MAQKNNIYFIGIGGIGMSALARYYKFSGCNVSGYDRSKSKLTEELELEGMTVHYEDNIDLIPQEFRSNKENTLVIYTPAVPLDMSELVYFMKNGYDIVKRSKALGVIASDKMTLAVSGTHGKTTTSTLLAHIMQNSPKGCTAFLGGISKNYNSNLLLSNSEFLVAEADEFDRSFLQLFPFNAVITSVDSDHLDIYGDHNKIKEAFEEFAQQVSIGGNLVVKKGVEIDLKKCKCKIYNYSYNEEADFYAKNISIYNGGFFKFDLVHPKGVINNCTLGTPGWINVENAIAASSLALLSGISEDDVKKALSSFEGVERRFDIRINNSRCSYIDDYAHHPKELSAAITSIRNIFEGKRITGIFQPHLYSRTKDFYAEFAESLSLLDQVILLDIYPARELPIEGVTSHLIYDKITQTKKQLISKELLLETIEKADIETLVTFGAGDIDRFVEPITQLLKRRFNV